jgi:FtsZ-binding cell division protein ZapB
MHEVKKASEHKSSLFTFRDTERKTFNISIAEEDKISKIKIKYDNISAPDKVQFHKQTSDLQYSDYLNFNLKNEKLTSLVTKLEGYLRQEKAASKAWQIQINKIEVDGPKEIKVLLDEKDKVILNLKKKLKMIATEHPWIAELVALEQEKESFKKQSLDFQAKFLQLEKEKLEWSKEKIEMATRVIDFSFVVPFVTPSVVEIKLGTEDIVQAMSRVSLKDGEIKELKENIKKIKQEAQKMDESVSQLKKENADLHEKMNKLNARLKGKRLLQGAKHIIWDSISVEVTKLRAYLNYVNDEDDIAVLAKQRCKVINET